MEWMLVMVKPQLIRDLTKEPGAAGTMHVKQSSSVPDATAEQAVVPVP
jgi:hypothetical protein